MELNELSEVMLNNYYQNLRDTLVQYINTTTKDQWKDEEYNFLKENFIQALQEINRRSGVMYNTG